MLTNPVNIRVRWQFIVTDWGIEKRHPFLVRLATTKKPKITKKGVSLFTPQKGATCGVKYIKDVKTMQEPKFLSDERKGKKNVNWRGHKMESVKLGDSFQRQGNHAKAFRVASCGDTLGFKTDSEGNKKLTAANFCKVRLCPMCAWRRSLKIFGQVSRVMDYVTERNNFKYVFLTLTVKNVPGAELSPTMDKLFEAFKKMTERKELKKMAKGWFRCLEVTHKWENGDDYHPHMHMIVAVNNGYFSSHEYLTHEKLMKLWRDCAGIDYDPWVHIETIKPKIDDGDGTLDYGKAVAEVAKYTVKSSDIILSMPADGEKLSVENRKRLEKWVNEETDKVVSVMDKALANRRLLSFGGVMRDAHKKLELDSVENGDLVNTDNEDQIRPDLFAVLEKYKWHPGWKNYVLEQVTD